MTGEFGSIDVPALAWDQPSMTRRYYRLASTGVAYAALEWTQVFRSMALSSSRQGQFTFKRGGFLHPNVTVRRKDFEMEMARIELNWSGSGDLAFTNGQRYRFFRSGILRFDYDVSDAKGNLLFSMREHGTLMRHGGEVRVTDVGLHNPDLALLITLSIYLSIMASDDVATASACAVT